LAGATFAADFVGAALAGAVFFAGAAFLAGAAATFFTAAAGAAFFAGAAFLAGALAAVFFATMRPPRLLIEPDSKS
jgi:hypothetical protein